MKSFYRTFLLFVFLSSSVFADLDEIQELQEISRRESLKKETLGKEAIPSVGSSTKELSPPVGIQPTKLTFELSAEDERDLKLLNKVNGEGFVYDPAGLRDPFFPVTNGRGKELSDSSQNEIIPLSNSEWDARDPYQSGELKSYRLAGILWEVKRPQALFVTSSNEVLKVRLKQRLGKEAAVVVAIREKEVVFALPNPDGTYMGAATIVRSLGFSETK